MSNVYYPLRSDRDIECAKDAAAHIVSLMRTLDRWNSIPLCAQFGQDHGSTGVRCVHPDSTYGHLWAALASTLRMLGVPDGSKMEMAARGLHDGVPISLVIQAYVPVSPR